jgi:hypothetical protein
VNELPDVLVDEVPGQGVHGEVPGPGDETDALPGAAKADEGPLELPFRRRIEVSQLFSGADVPRGP